MQFSFRDSVTKLQCCTFFSSPLSRCAGPGGLLSSPPGGSTFSPHSQSLLTSEGPPGASTPSQQSTGAPSSVGSGRRSARERDREDKRSVHIKKPLNAFMLYMKEMRPKIVAECTLKESAAINQILGRRVRISIYFFYATYAFSLSLLLCS